MTISTITFYFKQYYIILPAVLGVNICEHELLSLWQKPETREVSLKCLMTHQV